ncbi:MAG: hypothetical protein OHK0013_44370 [Sandaracinaceae bacterium]
MTEEYDEGVAFRPSVRPFVTALLANLALALLLLGIPYVRGRDRARASARGVAALSACLLDGEVRQELGLALPTGERERFATLFERGPEDWPGRCAPLLSAIDHEPATFLLPSPKASELDLHSAIESMGEALLDLERVRREGGPVPERPLEALGLLRGITAELLAANDLSIDPNEIGITLRPRQDALPTPSRVPVRTGSGFFRIEADRDPAVRIVVADGLGVAEVQVFEPAIGETSARVRLLQLRRPSGARGVVVGTSDAWLAWTTSEATCDADPRHCAMRATGLGRLLEGRRVMHPEYWIAAHPAGPPERSIVASDARFTVVARTADGGVEARVFARGEPMPAPTGGDGLEVAPTRAEVSRVLPGARDWVVGDGHVTALLETAAGREVRTVLIGEDPASDRVVASTPDAELLEPCGPFVVAIGSGHAQAIRAGTAWQRVALAARAPLRGPSREQDGVRVACDEDVVAIGALDADGVLTVHRCTALGCEAARWPRERVTSFDVAVHRGAVWALASGDERAPQIRAGTLPFDRGTPVVGACWSSHTGLCGPGRFATGGDRLLLAAREGSDVLVLTLGESGFEGLRGLVSVP